MIFTAETVANPGSHARAARLHKTRLNKCDGRVVINRIGIDGLDDADVVDDLSGVGQQLADLGSVLARPREFENRGRDRQRILTGGHARDALALPNRIGKLAAGDRGEFGFVVE